MSQQHKDCRHYPAFSILDPSLLFSLWSWVYSNTPSKIWTWNSFASYRQPI